MNTENQKITPLKNVEDQEKLKIKYEEESKAKAQQILDLQNKITAKNNEIFEKDKAIERLASEREDWKREAHSIRKIQSETKQAKEQQDFNTEFIKLQQKKGWSWDESQGWSKMN